MTPSRRRRFRRVCLSTLVAVYILIVVGGIVRSTGAGMGCPDWPTCFGRLIPPTSESQLPADYEQVYLAKREATNRHLANFLQKLGFSRLAGDVLRENAGPQERRFNAAKTWTEYLNRLVGVAIGLFVLATFLLSLSWRHERSSVPLLAAAALLAVGFNGWAGSLVVSTNLLPWMVTVHMLLALLVVTLLLLLLSASRSVGEASSWRVPSPSLLNRLLSATMVCMVLQIALGTQVREGVDRIARAMVGGERGSWIGHLGVSFYVHRSFSILLIILTFWLFWSFRRRVDARHPAMRRMRLLLGATLLEAVAGAGLAYFALPPFIQPLHLGLAALIFGLQLEILLRINQEARTSGRDVQAEDISGPPDSAEYAR